jgi:hypothetical protein
MCRSHTITIIRQATRSGLCFGIGRQKWVGSRPGSGLKCCVQVHIVIVIYYVLSLFIHHSCALTVRPLLVILLLTLVITADLSLLIITLVAVLLVNVLLRGSLAASSESVTLPPQGEDDGDEEDGQEAKERVAPVETQSVEHLTSEERERSSKAGTEEIVTGGDRGELCRVGVTEVVKNSGESTEGSDGEERGTDDGNNPVNRGLSSPTEHEETKGQADTGGECGLQSDLGAKSSVLRESRLDVVVVVVPVGRDTDDTTDTDTEIAQTSSSETELVDLFECEGNRL